MLGGKGKTQPFLSYVGLHNPVPADTFPRWLEEFISLSGIDTSIFTGYSTRRTSVSKSKQLGLSLSKILKKQDNL